MMMVSNSYIEKLKMKTSLPCTTQRVITSLDISVHILCSFLYNYQSKKDKSLK